MKELRHMELAKEKGNVKHRYSNLKKKEYCCKSLNKQREHGRIFCIDN